MSRFDKIDDDLALALEDGRKDLVVSTEDVNQLLIVVSVAQWVLDEENGATIYLGGRKAAFKRLEDELRPLTEEES